MPDTPLKRRSFLQSSLLGAGATFCGLRSLRASPQPVLGQNGFRYRVVPGWGVLDEKTPVKNCHGILADREGNVLLLTDHTANNVIVYDRTGKLIHKWGTAFPGAHGFSIVSEGAREVLFITDLQRHRIFKTSLDGNLLDEWSWPEASGKYEREDQYKPSWTLHLPSGDFFTLDGYGRDFISRYDGAGKWLNTFGGKEGGIAHWGPHGGMMDLSDPDTPSLMIAMSDQQHLLRLSLDGHRLGVVGMPGGNPRQIRRHQDHFFVAHLADNWPADRNSRGFISVLNADFKVLANIGGTEPVYQQDGVLQRMQHDSDLFTHPHDLAVDAVGDIYVAQFASGNTYPIKLERV